MFLNPGTGRASRLPVIQFPFYLPPSKFLLQIGVTYLSVALFKGEKPFSWETRKGMMVSNVQNLLFFFYALFPLSPLLPQVTSHYTYALKSFLQPFLTRLSYPFTYGRVYTRPEFPNCTVLFGPQFFLPPSYLSTWRV